VEQVRSLLAAWQAADRTGRRVEPDVSGADASLTHWRDLDAPMSDAEREAEDRLWEEVLRGMDETRSALGMRPLCP
jgi:hypothetical protein